MADREQWKCDVCGEMIEAAEEGWLEWHGDRRGKQQSGFRIVHNREGCVYDQDDLFRNGRLTHDMHLETYTGYSGLERLLEILDREDVQDKSEVTEIIRRLHIPGHEQQRLKSNDDED